MVELEQALGRLPDDPDLTPEPFPAIVARADRRRRRRRLGQGAASVVGLAAIVVGVAASLPDSAQVVGTADRPVRPTVVTTGLPATGGQVAPAPPISPDSTVGEIDGTPSTTANPQTEVPRTTVADPDGTVSSPILPAPSDPFVPPGSDPSISACPPGDVVATMTTAKAVYAPGERVTGTSLLENRSSAACLVPARARFAVQDQAGNDVSGFAYTADYAMPVKAEPGQSFPGSFSWDQTDCSGAACSQVPAGTYVAVAIWSEGGSFSARASFQVGA